jgi:hypothetical protein
VRGIAAALVLTVAGCASAPPLDPAVFDRRILAAGSATVDQRAAFRDIFCATLARTAPEAGPCDAFLWRDPTEEPAAPRAEPPGPLRADWRVVMVSGYASDCVAPWFRMFGDARPRLSDMGIDVMDAPVAGLAGTEWNAAILAETLTGVAGGPGKRTLVVGYSKGAADIIEMLGAYPEAAARVDAVVSISGSLGGAQLAQTAPQFLDALIEHAPGADCAPHDGRALWSLRPDVRAARLAARPRPAQPPIFVLAGFVERDQVSRALAGGWETLTARGALTDGQLTVEEQSTPGAVLLGHPRADHWAAALPISEAAPAIGGVAADRNAYPRDVLIESVVRFIDRTAQD